MKAALFDFGGTLDTEGVHWSEEFWRFYERFHIGVEKKAFEKAFVAAEGLIAKEPGIGSWSLEKTLRRQFELQFASLGIQVKTSIADLMWSACYYEVKRASWLAAKTLARLQRDYVMGVVSNFYGNLEVVCKELGLSGFFAALVDSAVVGVRKPDPRIFSLAFERLNANPADSFVIGDSYERDIVPAKSLGCSTIWLKGTSWDAPASTDAADHVVSQLDEITKIMLKF